MGTSAPFRCSFDFSKLHEPGGACPTVSFSRSLSICQSICVFARISLSVWVFFLLYLSISFFLFPSIPVSLFVSVYVFLSVFFSLSLTNSNLSLSLFPSFTLPLQFCSPIPFLFFLHSSLSFHLFHSHLISLSEKRKCDQEEKEEEGEGEYAY